VAFKGSIRQRVKNLVVAQCCQGILPLQGLVHKKTSGLISPEVCIFSIFLSLALIKTDKNHHTFLVWLSQGKCSGGLSQTRQSIWENGVSEVLTG
jgi:hypothetical protein